MKKKITLITSILLILALAVTFVGCNKDKEVDEPTTEASEVVSTTEPTTFEVPEIKDEPTTEETTEATTEAPETTKKPTYSYNSGSSSNSGSSNSGSNSKPASTTKASSSNSGGWVSTGKNGDVESFTNSSGFTINIDTGSEGGGHGSWEDSMTDPDVIEAEGAHNGR